MAEQRKIVIRVTGFGEFCGVADNPTMHMIHALQSQIIQEIIDEVGNRLSLSND